MEPLVGSQTAFLSRKMIYGYFHANTPSQLRQNAREVYQEHYKRIRQATPKNKLLEYRLGDRWEPLCKFLGKNMPEGVPFPKQNEAAALRAKFRDEQVEARHKGGHGTHQIPCADSGSYDRDVILVSKSSYANSSMGGPASRTANGLASI